MLEKMPANMFIFLSLLLILNFVVLEHFNFFSSSVEDDLDDLDYERFLLFTFLHFSFYTIISNLNNTYRM